MGWEVNDTTRSVYLRERDQVPNVQKVWWAEQVQKSCPYQVSIPGPSS